ncbi:helix-turn-helix domain-containing protein [Candidatus Uhrbacteria bacterium]|nr:helix-turn-helix domain-containing protein [Candidatus Uhrbacteria bacterium]
MAKFTPNQNLSKELKQKVLLELCQAMVMVKKLPDAAKVLSDLLSEQELQMIAKRLQVAKLLLQKKTYAEIKKALNVSQHTIARVNIWLQQGGAGFRMVMDQGLDLKIPAWKPWAGAGDTAYSWGAIKRKMPMYFWPQLLLEEIVRSANNKQRLKLLGTLKILGKAGKEKKEAFRYLEDILNQGRRSPRQKQNHTREMVLGIK